MKVLLIGAGGREHALAWKCLQSPLLSELIVAPGNAGIAEMCACVPLPVDNTDTVLAFCQDRGIDFVIVGPEAPLVAGLADTLSAAGIEVFGPSAAAAQLEGSKAFTKALCANAAIPTAAYAAFDTKDAARAHITAQGAPIVVKADGLAAGKGVTVATSVEEALEAVDRVFADTADESVSVVIEECLTGPEASLFALVDGETVVLLGTAQDHKRAFDGDKGPNTGGMGAFSPSVHLTDELAEIAMERIVRPTAAWMNAQGTPFRGTLYAGLILTNEGPKLIEYNVRFGDPECQVLMLRLRSDLLDLMVRTSRGTLTNTDIDFDPDPALTVVMAARGYPGSYQKGMPIDLSQTPTGSANKRIFHAGTAKSEAGLVANGGRVLNICAKAATLEAAREQAYLMCDRVVWPDGFFRTDIGAV